MEGVEFTMTFLRVIKWFSFVVFILALALAGVAHGFIFNEMGIFDDEDGVKYMMGEVRDAVQASDDYISSLFNKEEEPAEEADEPAAPVLIENSTSSEPIAPETAEPAEGEAAVSAYSCEGKNEIVLSVMKYGSYQIEMDWLNKLSEEIIGASSIKINLSVMVSYIALFVAFILHIVTKHTKSFYGYILMFFGYILFAVIFLFGYYIGAIIGYVEISLKSDDMQFIKTFIIMVSFALATLIGLPYYRLGVRQIANKTYKKRIDNYKKKLQRR